ncbi:putative nonribosomal siderophore peptide synthase [Phaeomoniella chlamydospora]|uniref:Nonribosomal peptide synthetase sidC n=1 Tax=Phaeomoniella chlamydospora TaxID=158046 RepID=A0A0G2ERV2_PHACM|nr:putative nonribosomal siderophore peptide synthase [Phaeomoniella chlamydospora]
MGSYTTPRPALPVTRIPPLHTLEQHVENTKPPRRSIQRTRSIAIPCQSGGAWEHDKLLESFARFLGAFTGLDALSFTFDNQSLTPVDCRVKNNIVEATFPECEPYGSTGLRKVSLKKWTASNSTQEADNSELTDFGLELQPSGHIPSSIKQPFILHLSINDSHSILHASISYPNDLIPKIAADQVLNVAVSELKNADSGPTVVGEILPFKRSILNFPSLSHPPEIDVNNCSIEGQDQTSVNLLHSSFENNARSFPDRPALDFLHTLPSVHRSATHSILTYGKLQIAAERLADTLLARVRGRQRENRRIIPVFMPTSPELYISYLGILKAGFAFCPLPIDAPKERLKVIIDDLEADTICGIGPALPQQLLLGDSESSSINWVDVTTETRWNELIQNIETGTCSEQLQCIRRSHIQEYDLAYIMYTSGSTGKPKGVQITHFAVTCSINSHSIAIPRPEDAQRSFRWFQFASPTFDPSLMEIFVTLSMGGTLCSAERQLTLTDIEAVISELKATIMMATPSLASLLRPQHLTSLRSLWTMGEKLNRKVIGNFAHDSPLRNSKAKDFSCSLVNAYGPTEGSINCTVLAPVPYHTRGSVIGKALPTCSMFVLDTTKEIPVVVPSGMIGELAIGGPQVSLGYLNRPEESKKAFVNSSDFGRLYKTGDMARIVWDENGDEQIEFLGRINTDQAKLSGRRVELGEIEVIIASVPLVDEVVAVVHKRQPEGQGSEHVVACIVSQSNESTDTEEILKVARNKLRQTLPSFMCPDQYIFLKSFPRSSSGKVDRKAIMSLVDEYFQEDNEGPRTQSDVNQPNLFRHKIDPSNRDEIFMVLQSLVAEVVHANTATISLKTDVFTLGIDSLRAMVLLQKCRDVGIYGLSVGDILLGRTMNALVSRCADLLSQSKSQESGDKITGLSKSRILNTSKTEAKLAEFSGRNRKKCAEMLGLREDNIQNTLPTTATQSGMIASFLRNGPPGARSYIYHSILTLAPGVHTERLEHSFNEVMRRYESFRTVFACVDDDLAPFAQCIIKSSPGPVLNRFQADDGEEQSVSTDELVNVTIQEAERKIDISSNPWHAKLIQKSGYAVVVLSMFHGIFDGGSLALLLHDVWAEYHGHPEVCRSSISKAVFSHFSADYDATDRFWSEHLMGFSPIPFPCLTGNRPECATKIPDVFEIVADISWSRLRDGARILGATPLAILQAAWATILLAYGDSEIRDCVIGSVISGRFDSDTENCVGPTFTTVPLRVCPDLVLREEGIVLTNASMSRHLASLNAKALSHLQPQLGSLITEDGRLPYDTLLAVQDFSAGPEAKDLWQTVQHPRMANDFAVMIEAWPLADDSLTLRASFSDTHLDKPSAKVMLEQLGDTIEWILQNPEGRFEHTCPRIRSSNLSRWDLVRGLESLPEAGAGLLHAQFEQHAESHPDDPALVYIRNCDCLDRPLNVQWTYSDLNSRSSLLAEHLTQMCGSLQNAVVPISIEKIPALYVAILAILKSGGAWCPIDTLSPPERRCQLISRTGSKVVLVADNTANQPAHAVPCGVRLIDVSYFAGKPAIAPSKFEYSHKLKDIPSSESPAYVIWTSGTTGAPKGVRINHSAASIAMRSLQEAVPVKTQHGKVRALQFSQVTFDVSVMDLFYTWGVGGVLISSTREIMLGSFSRLTNMTAASHAFLTPTFAASVARNACDTLEVALVIGEPLTQPVADEWSKNLSFLNTYGPAETTVISTTHLFGARRPNIKSRNIGWPLPSVSAYVLKDDHLVLKNGVGELVHGGPQLAAGYLDQPDKTKERFIWSNTLGQRVYRTGDMVRMLHDGSMEYINRVDDLVKLNGIRVELSEISFSLSSCHSLAEQIETCILCRIDRPSKTVVTFISAPSIGGSGTADSVVLTGASAIEIINAAVKKAQQNLPKHMHPSVYIILNKIPKTPSAKADRKALQKIYENLDIEAWEREITSRNSDNKEEQIALSSEELIVIESIASLVGVPRRAIKLSSRLGALGLDSIRAIRLASRLNERGFPVSVTDVMQCLNVHNLVDLIDNCHHAVSFRGFDVNAFDRTWHDAARSRVQQDFIIVPTTPLQESLLSETMGNESMYWSNHFFALDGSVDIERLRRAWLEVANSIEVLRTGFISAMELTHGAKSKNMTSRSMLQIIYADTSLDWIYMSANSPGAVDDLLMERIKKVKAKHQALMFKNPPWAISIFEQNKERTMVLTIHHAIHDGPSLDLIKKRVQQQYLQGGGSGPEYQLRDALPMLLPPNSDGERKCEDFWIRALENFVDTEGHSWPDLTGRRDSKDHQEEFISASFSFSLPSEMLNSMAHEDGPTSIAAIIRAGWGFMVASYLSCPAVVLGETISDRVLSSMVQNVVGPLISVIPLPIRIQGTTREVLAEQRAFSARASKYRHIHANTVRKVLQRPQGQSLYPSLINFNMGSLETYSTAKGLWLELEDRVGLAVEHPAALNVYEQGDLGLLLEISCSTSIMNKDQLVNLRRQLESLLHAMVEYPDVPMVELTQKFPVTLLSKSMDESTEIEKQSNNISPTFWIEQIAKEHPDWIAVELAKSLTEHDATIESMNYSMLDSSADQISNFLVHSGIHKRVIGVCMGRTLPAYSAIVGIFKSNNCYLPIDEDLPDERKSLLVADGDCPVIFTERALQKSFKSIPQSCRIICMDDPNIQSELGAFATSATSVPASPVDNAYLLYTSGSTGKPKGVMVSRGNLSSFVEALSSFTCDAAPATKSLGGSGKWLGLASRAFDVHILEMFLAWRHGLAAASGPRSMLLNDLGLALSHLKVSHASFVPSLLDQAGLEPSHYPALRFITVGGEKISKRVVDTWGASQSVALVNAYGPTEVTIGCSFKLVTPETSFRNIGKPLGTSVAHVLIPNTDQYALRSLAGELCLTGDLVANGYHNRPDAKGFVEDFHGRRMYRTGDIVRLMVDDNLEFLGRGDDQTKIRGQRLELGEVSEVIRKAFSEKIDVVAAIIQHPSLRRAQLGAFIARTIHRSHHKGEKPRFLEQDYRTWATEVQDMCKQQLPSYMVPEYIIPLDFLPLAPVSGKVDMKQLQTTFSSIPLETLLQRRPSNDGLNVCPGRHRELTPCEKEIVEVIARLTSTDSKLMVHNSNIFEVGVDSLSAISLTVMLRDLGYSATVAKVLARPSIDQLALLPRANEPIQEQKTALEKARQAIDDLQASYMKQLRHDRDKEAILHIRPCLPLQEGLVAISVSGGANQTYINHITLQLSVEVDIAELRRAWTETVTENPILRTCFGQLDHEFVQVVYKSERHNIIWEEDVVESVEGAVAEFRSSQKDINAEIIASIFLTPPIRFRIIQSNGRTEQPVMLISIHHSLYDGESLVMILNEVASRYQRDASPSRGSADDFISFVQSQDKEKAREYWTEYLRDLSPTLFDIGNDRGPNPPILCERRLQHKLSEIEKFSATQHYTTPSLVQGIFAVVLAELYKTCDVSYGVVLSGRLVPVAEVDSILLPCITTIAQRVNFANFNSVASALVSVQKSNAEALEHQHTSLRLIQRWTGSSQRLFDSLFSYVRARHNPHQNLWTESDSSMPADYPLSVEFEADPEYDCITVRCSWNSKIGTVTEAETFLEKIDVLISSIMGEQEIKLDSIGLMSVPSAIGYQAEDLWDEQSWSEIEKKLRQLISDFCEVTIEQTHKNDLPVHKATGDILHQSQLDAWKTKIVPLSAQDYVTNIFQCTPLQSGMLTGTLGSGGGMYVHHHTVLLEAEVSLERLRYAWSHVVEKRDILRTSFHNIQELGFSWIGAVHQDPFIQWEEIRSQGSVENSFSEIVRTMKYTTEDAFDYPPLKIWILHGPAERSLVLSMHHSLYDGTSVPFIFDDLATAYAGHDLAVRPPFVSVVQPMLRAEQEATSFWSRKLADYDPVRLPPLERSKASQSMHLSVKQITAEVSKVVELCREFDVTVQTVALLSFAKVLASHIGRRDVVFGHVVAGRSLAIPNIEDTIGPLFNTLPYRIKLEPKFMSNQEMARQLQKMNSEAQVHQHAPLRSIQNHLRSSGALKKPFLFDSLFVFQNTSSKIGSIDCGNGLWKPSEKQHFVPEAEYTLNIEVEQSDESIKATASCNGQFITKQMLENFLTDFETAFLDTIENPTRYVCTFPPALQHLPLQLTITPSTNDLDTPDEDIPAATRDTLKRVLANASKLSADLIRSDTSIFSLGLDSISAIRVASNCRAEGLNVGVADVIQGNTLRGICRRIGSKKSLVPQSAEINTIPITDRQKVLETLEVKGEAIEAIVPCMAGQMYHIASWLNSRRTLFEPAWPFVSCDRLNIEKLRTAWAHLRRHHPILRSCFVATTSDQVFQVVLDRGTVDEVSTTFDIIELPSDVKNAAIAQAKTEAQQPSSLFIPPIRLRLVRANDADAVLLILNHTTYDAWSIPLLVSDLTSLYFGHEPTSNPNFVQFANFTSREHQLITPETFWHSTLHDCTPTLIMDSYTEGSQPKGSLPKQTFVAIHGALPNLADLTSRCNTKGLSLPNVIFLAIFRTLSRVTGSKNPTFGLYQLGRSSSFDGIEKLAGPCVNVLPFVSRQVLDRSALEAITEIQSELNKRIPYEQSSLRDVLKWVGYGNDKPLFDVWVNLLWAVDEFKIGNRNRENINTATSIQKHDGSTNGKEDLLSFLPLGLVPTDIASKEPFPGETSVDKLDTSFLPKYGLYVDIGPELEIDSIGFGVRCEGDASEAEIKKFIRDICDEVKIVVAGL